MEREIARFNERITFQRNSTVIDKYKNHKLAWADWYSCAAYASTYQYDKEHDGGVITLEEQTINFEVRYCSELKYVDSTHYRIVFHDAVYDIISVDFMNYQRKTIRVRSRLHKSGGESDV